MKNDTPCITWVLFVFICTKYFTDLFIWLQPYIAKKKSYRYGWKSSHDFFFFFGLSEFWHVCTKKKWKKWNFPLTHLLAFLFLLDFFLGLTISIHFFIFAPNIAATNGWRRSRTTPLNMRGRVKQFFLSADARKSLWGYCEIN